MAAGLLDQTTARQARRIATTGGRPFPPTALAPSKSPTSPTSYDYCRIVLGGLPL
jgi:hypothetical protein